MPVGAPAPTTFTGKDIAHSECLAVRLVPRRELVTDTFDNLVIESVRHNGKGGGALAAAVGRGVLPRQARVARGSSYDSGIGGGVMDHVHKNILP